VRVRLTGGGAMCRWIVYYGEEVCIAKLIFGAAHGLAHMSEAGPPPPPPPETLHL
jgi:hypothetical protein